MSMFPKEPVNVKNEDGVLKCLVCGHDEFFKREAQLNSKVSELLGMAWTDKSAVCYVCKQCGYIHWFLSSPG